MIHCDTGEFAHERHGFFHRVLTTQSPRMTVDVRWLCGWRRGSAGAGCGPRFNESCIQQAEFVHKTHSVITHWARQSQIVADKINAASTYE